MRLAVRSVVIARETLVDRPRLVEPIGIPITAPWAPTRPYRQPAADVAGHMRLCARGHVAAPGKPCRGCKRVKAERGGWGVTCSKAAR